MRFGRLEHVCRTLRFRLTVWNTAMIVVLLLATLAGLRAGLRWTLQRELDATLTQDVAEAQLAFEGHWPNTGPVAELLDRKALTHNQRTWFALLLDTGGNNVWATRNSPQLAPAPVAPLWREPFDLGGYRVAQCGVKPHGCPPMVVRVGCSRAEVDEDVTRLSDMLLVAGAVVLVVAPLGGYWLAGRATRPLGDILQTADRLRPNRLVERLPLRGSGDELDHLSATINGLLDRLADHLRRQREFVANAAHELRSPLAAMRTAVDVALAHDRTAPEYRELLAELAEHCSALGGLVKDLLLLAEGEAGMQATETMARLDKLANRAADMFRGVAETHGIVMQVGPLEPAPVRGGEAHLREVIHNLLDNALKFTPAGGRVSLAVTRVPGPGPGWASLQVADTGCGIPAADLPHVFERFYRADKSRQRGQAGGSGLGLSICQAIVTACGGRVTLDSHEGAGTTATVLLPLAE
jgi:signal transduction histidine kinase